MQERKASSTAIATAVQRAAHQSLDAEPKILDDPVAIGLVEGSTTTEIQAQRVTLQQPLFQLSRSLFVLRSRFVEDQLAEAATRGVRQYVILGAGLDTFAYRQPAWAADLRIFEVDHPDSQAYKRECLVRARAAIPHNVVFCPLDFERTTLLEGLASVAFEARVPTFFSWLGVTQYLTHAAIELTLRAVLTVPPPTRIALTFVLPEAGLEGEDRQALLWGAARAAELGEPFLTHFEPQPLRQWLLDLGFAEVFHLAPELAAARYFAGRTDGLRAPICEQLICAAV